MTGAERTLKRNARDDMYNVLYMMEAAQHLAGMRAAHTQRRWSADEDRILLKLNSPAAPQ
ncbi:hypothetical protein [Streptomyces cylindrosporus]|uniref:Uncharacterized protein n=1 Tax=Streptomyces cylindrosporus TaxID=2927583 RepID=A0ABS9YNS6_9ACTN|nr:hypothetical protein [Streptomyces cylindrosporus]MCI3278917.1 hypothetical protein [Streptomyces cylindrosporus]